ncbi:hypothetical protein ATCC90586_005259 [Pythium insidiosum]|nr:hypothetical protein ATCC90586_005259 [Pythium insidiosum]
MTPEEIQGDYSCSITVEDYRVNKKAEYKVVVHIAFFSSRTNSIGHTCWHIWRTFTAFRKLDEQLRKRNAAHLKGIKFPPLYRRRSLFRTNLNAEFLERRMRELDNYVSMLVRSPQLVAFHVTSVQSQTMKSFVGFANGFGSDPHYEQPNDKLRPSMSILATPASVAVMRDTVSVMGDDDDDFRSVSSISTISSVASSAYSAAGQGGDYRWSGTGFVGSHSFARPVGAVPPPGAVAFGSAPMASPYGSASTASSSSFVSATPRSSRGSWFPTTGSIGEGNAASIISSDGRPSVSMARNSMMAVTPSSVITPEIDMQRGKMEEQLHKFGLMGVGMPPDGSCLLHCVVYEMYPLQCLRDYPPGMTVVNVGAADGVAPRRVAAAHLLRIRLSEYAMDHVDILAKFLMQDPEDLRERYETFRDTPDEQATIAELYAIASMFNIQIVLITNDESFKIDPVQPIEGLPSVREGAMRTVTFGYLIPADGVAGHYICTRERRSPLGVPQNSFAGGSYRGSINIGPPKGLRCSPAGPRIDRIPEQQRVE